MKVNSRCILSLMAFLFMLSLGWAKDYYVDSATGNDSRDETSPGSAWCSISKVNSTQFSPGDNIYFKRGSVWEEELIVSSSGSENNFITFGAYGTGNNPKIKCSNNFDDWTIHIHLPHVKVWKGKIKWVRNSWGAMKDGLRLPSYYPYKKEGSLWSRPNNLATMLEGVSYGPLNSSIFFIRNDAGNPGELEVGAREYGILVREKKFVVIDSIDVFGPSGSPVNGSDTAYQIQIEACDNIIVKNCTASNSTQGGIAIINGSTNCLIDNINSYGHKSTGVYFWSAGSGNAIVNSSVYNCGNILSDHGDMGLIGIWQTSGVRVEHCVLHSNGHDGVTIIDAGISYVQSPNGNVNRCEIFNIAGNALQFSEGSDGSMATYNVIYDWGIYGLPEKNHGIRIGGGIGASTATNCKVFNNLFDNRRKESTGGASLRVLYHNNKGLQVKNNIFLNKELQYDLFIESRDNYTDWNFSNNIYHRTSGVSVYYNKLLNYDYEHLFGNIKGYFSFDTEIESNSIKGDPLIFIESKTLSGSSPCINKGFNVGLRSDFNGNNVPYGGTTDIGPFEFQFVKSPQSLQISK
jgi:hypothetical protein